MDHYPNLPRSADRMVCAWMRWAAELCNVLDGCPRHRPIRFGKFRISYAMSEAAFATVLYALARARDLEGWCP
jgi:hypothetical protein